MSKAITVKEILGIYLYGLRLDISTSTYILLLPFISIIPTIFFKPSYLKVVYKTFTILLLFIISLLTIGDLELYKYWGFRLDATPLIYINTPGEMMASVSWFVVIRQFLIMALLIWGGIKFYNYFVHKHIDKITQGKWYELIIYPIFFGLLVIAARGGIGIAPLSTGTAYFCKNGFANHAAINMVWNVGYSLTVRETLSNPYKEFNHDDAKLSVDNLFNKNFNTQSIIKKGKTNIIIILVESFTAKAISVLGGTEGVTPRFNKLCKEGILFDNFYASGIRSDKGIVSVISGYPAQPIASIIQFPNKTESLPYITKDLQTEGYNTAFYYGGDPEFASMQSYLQNANFNNVVTVNDFPEELNDSKWGVADNFIFTKLYNDINIAKSPFFYFYFTLSSHEPFDVPMKTVIHGDDIDHKFMNSLYYTDSCLGDFIDKAKTSTWWNNTIIVVTADHGSRAPYDTENFVPKRFHIPMLWLGGALLATDTVIHNIASQTDLAQTLLNQLNIKPAKEYQFSNDIFSSNSKNIAFCAYTNGFLYVNDSNKIAFDYDEKAVKLSEGSEPDSTLRMGKQYLQVLYDDFMHR
jgi:phosphoglycerol transferase MdoB-like AlkP superfamily enzyme